LQITYRNDEGETITEMFIKFAAKQNQENEKTNQFGSIDRMILLLQT
jgi:hypothetical protein